MKRIAGGLALAAGLLAFAPPALAGEPGDADGRTSTEKRLDEVLAELEAQRTEIRSLQARLAAEDGSGGVGDSVKQYLESEEGKKALGKGATDFKVSWKDGLSFETSDKQFSLKVQGRIMYDMVFPDADDDLEAAVGDFDPTVGFRRLRVEMGGTIFENIFYQNTIDFSATPHQLKDNFIGMKGLPGGLQVQAGYFKEPVGLEELTSSKYITFMERSLATNAFAPAHNMGIQASGSHMEDRLNWAFGDFTDHAVNGVGPTQWQHNFTGRICGAPVLDKEKKQVVHLGLSVQDRSPETENDRFRARPEMPFVPRTVDTGTISVDTEFIIGLEAAWVSGPISIQGEYFTADIDDHPDAPGGSPSFDGYYLQASYWLTGESRPYSKGTFGRVKPKSEFTTKGGTGALELKARFASVDLDDDGVTGGEGDDITIGANWHLNSNTRVMLEWITHDADLAAVSGTVTAIQVRFQIDF
ncbi:MAG TPA: porin [Planctomycetota bacterium]|nr:porin [Planctomycetota bacterium]